MATTKTEYERRHRQAQRLIDAGFTFEETEQLRRIGMTLRRWFELECGDSNDYCSFAIERDEKTDRPFMVRHSHRAPFATTQSPVRDAEKGARKRLQAIVDARNARRTAHDLTEPIERQYAVMAYVQTDPRGCALYILRPGDVPEGSTADCCYTNGIAVA